MDINFFDKNFRIIVDELLDERIISDKGNDLDKLSPSSWTFLFNVAVYKLVKKYKEEIGKMLCLIPEGNSGKKGGFSDLKIVSDDGKITFIEIEHENDAKRLLWAYDKLIESDAKCKILVGYENKKWSKNDIIGLLRGYKNQINTDTKAYLILGTEDLKEANKEYRLIEL